MKKTAFTLLGNINEYSRNLIAVHPYLPRFAHNLSTQDLAQLTSFVHNDSSSGKPVRPPTEFILAVKQVVFKKEWMLLYELLEKWTNGSEVPSHPRLSGNELEYLTLGLLWETLLVTECERRLS
jgi:hypothetical protein